MIFCHIDISKLSYCIKGNFAALSKAHHVQPTSSITRNHVIRRPGLYKFLDLPGNLIESYVDVEDVPWSHMVSDVFFLCNGLRKHCFFVVIV